MCNPKQCDLARAPVAFGEFADPPKRAQWVRDQNLTVFSVYSPEHPLTEVDLFVESSLDFDDAYQHAVQKEIVPGVRRICSTSRTFPGSARSRLMSDDQTGAIWEHRWEGHAQHQRERLANLPFSEKLRWLEEAHRLVRHLSSTPPKPADRPDGESEP